MHLLRRIAHIGPLLSNWSTAGVEKRKLMFLKSNIHMVASNCSRLIPELGRSECMGVSCKVFGWGTINKQLSSTVFGWCLQGMIECQKLGLTKSIGVSNFNRRQLKVLFDHSPVKPANQQVSNISSSYSICYINCTTR